MIGVSGSRVDLRGWVDTVVVGLIAALMIVWFGQWLDNAHIPTSNGMFKSIDVEQWKLDFSAGRLDQSNYLYYPLMGLLCRVLGTLGVHAGQVWRQLVVIDSIFAGVAVAFVYWMVRSLTSRRDIAVFAALFHAGSAYFLCLAVSDEDILPSYTLVLAAMAMAAVWFAAPTIPQVACIATLFTLGWLIEWRLVFPTLPPLLLALALSYGTSARRAGLLLLFLGITLVLPLLAANRWEGHLGAVGLPGLLWTGKGIATGWAGFSLEKLGLVVAGMGEYWLGGRNMPAARPFTSIGAEWLTAFGLQVLLLAFVLALFWRKWHDPVTRTVAIVFLGTLGAGEVMNAYSQPGDPQMQINVMPWMTVAVALLVAEISAARRGIVTTLMALVAMLPLAYNIWTFTQKRGVDGKMESALRELEQIVDPARTVFVYTAFEDIVAWQYLEWAHHWEGVCDLAPAPLAVPKFKWANMFGPIVHHPSSTKGEYAMAIKTEIDCAFDKGYRVVAGPFWSESEQQLALGMTELNAGDYGPVLYSVVHSYRGAPIGGPSAVGTYYELTRP